MDAKGITIYQRLIGIGVWLTTIGRIDILYPINQMSRYSSAPREGHLKLLKGVFQFINKWRNRGIVSRGADTIPFWNQIKTYKMVKPGNMKEYYRDSEFLDLPNALEPKGKPVEINIFVDANHGDDKKDRKSVTGYVIFVGDMPYKWGSKRQKI